MADKGNGGFNLGDFLKGVGVFAAAATIPGFGQGFAQAQARKQAIDAQQRLALFKAAANDPTIALNKGFQGDFKRLFGTEALQGFIEAGQNAQAAQAIQQLQLAMAQGAPAPQPVPGETPPEAVGTLAGQNQFGEATGFVTPTGLGVSRQGFTAPKRAGVNPGGQTQTSLSVGPEGKIRQTIGPVTAETRRFNAQERFRQTFRAERERLLAQGLDETSAEIVAAKTARDTPGTAVPEAFRGLTQLGGATERAAFEKQAGSRRASLAVPQRASAAQAIGFKALSETAKNVDKIFTLFKKDESRFGPFKGRKESLLDIFGAASPEIRQFRRLRQIVVTNLGRAISGQAISEPESRRLNRLLPDLEDTPENFVGGMRAFLQAFQSDLESSRETFGAQNIIVPDIQLSPQLQAILEESGTPATPGRTQADAEAEAAAFLESIGQGGGATQ